MNYLKQKLHSLWGTYLYYKYKNLYKKNPALAADAMYKKIYGRHMNLLSPKNLIEKITWLSLNTDTSLWTLCADKYRMRTYVQEKGFGEYLPKLYGHWDNPDDIIFSELPDSFVLKANNGCATVKIVKDKNTVNEAKIKKELKSWLGRQYGYMGAQSHYLAIPPCIIAEELLIQDDKEKQFSPSSIVDYKFWTFNGKTECILVTYNRTEDTHSVALYDSSWNPIFEKLRKHRHNRINSDVDIPKPKCFDFMKKIAMSLASDFPECRVDFYVTNNTPYIGELTFTAGYGSFTDEYYDYLGNKVNITYDK